MISSAERSVIRLRTLGQLDLEGPGGREVRNALAQPRRAALLVYLALATPRGHHRRDALLALFWPESDIERARNALNQALHFLRLSLGNGTIINRSGDDALTLDWDSVWCDALEFEEALATGRRADALDLYQGDLLAGFHVGDAPEFERWLDAERARYAALYAEALEAVAAERERARDFAGANIHWKRLAARDPYNARVALRLMQSLVASGDAAAAVRHARVHAALLQEELGIAPDADITALVQQLQNGGGAKAIRSTTSTPSPHEAHVSALEGASAPVAEVARPRETSRRRRLAFVAGTMIFIAAMVIARATSGHPDPVPKEQYLRSLYVRGRNAELSRSPLGIHTAKAAYHRAIEVDSTFALGYAGLAGVYGFIVDYALGPAAPALDSARMMANRAVALDSTLPEAHTALAVALGDVGQFDAAEREFNRAIQLEEKNADAHYWYSVLLVALGRGAEALREAKRAEQLETVAPRGVLAMQRYAEYLLTGKRPHLGLPVVAQRPVLKLEPGEPWARGREAIAFAREGNCAAARSSMDLAQQLAPDNIRMLSDLGEIYWRCGEQKRAKALLATLQKRPDAQEHGNRVAVLYLLFGDRDSTFFWLDRQVWTLSSLSALSAAEFADPLRDDVRYARLLRRIGIRK
jgi:DNA-binding SARP family transcriptional activator